MKFFCPNRLVYKTIRAYQSSSLNKKEGVIRVEIFIYITAAMLITVFINITAAGWLSIKMAEFMWEKVRRL